MQQSSEFICEGLDCEDGTADAGHSEGQLECSISLLGGISPREDSGDVTQLQDAKNGPQSCLVFSHCASIGVHPESQQMRRRREIGSRTGRRPWNAQRPLKRTQRSSLVRAGGDVYSTWSPCNQTRIAKVMRRELLHVKRHQGRKEGAHPNIGNGDGRVRHGERCNCGRYRDFVLKSLPGRVDVRPCASRTHVPSSRNEHGRVVDTEEGQDERSHRTRQMDKEQRHGESGGRRARSNAKWLRARWDGRGVV